MAFLNGRVLGSQCLSLILSRRSYVSCINTLTRFLLEVTGVFFRSPESHPMIDSSLVCLATI